MDTSRGLEPGAMWRASRASTVMNYPTAYPGPTLGPHNGQGNRRLALDRWRETTAPVIVLSTPEAIGCDT